MLTNRVFLEVVRSSFGIYLSSGGSSRSTAKLIPLHGGIANDIKEKLGVGFTVKSKGIGDGSEQVVNGRYCDKNVDITVLKKETPVAGFAVKFVMQNYSQNSVNYFENMLGETANIRTNDVPYFQIFIIFSKVPYYKKGGEFDKYDVVSAHNLEKYLKLSNDNPSVFYHTPDKTLIVVIDLKEKSKDYQFKNDKEYIKYYSSVIKDKDLMRYHVISDEYGDSVIINNYEDFIERTSHIILGKLKNSGNVYNDKTDK